ncbi:MAG: NAD-dependent epimerase/dehydratase family protein, partial [Leptospiraceae bacterium]|nr:NAD-dependent epimerase/dehydratase family protein [Leptospiraceae bacterium]
LDLVLNDFVASAITTKRIEILSDGTPWRPLINVKDMARAIEWSLERTVEQGGAFLAVNTGSNKWNYQVRELAEAVSKIIKDTSISINPNAQPDKRSYKVNFDKFETLAPQHKPQISLEETIQELSDALRKVGFHDFNFRQSTYMRLNKLKQLQNSGRLDSELYWSNL